MIYTNFAAVYDSLINMPTQKWVWYIRALWQMHGFSPKAVLDLACGTGNITHLLSKGGYDLIGIDMSEDMLAVARQKGSKPLFVCQDMRKFELHGAVDAIICLCDSLNYLDEPKDLLAVFRRVKKYLKPGGCFIFDINTPYKYEHILANNTFSQIGRDSCYIWVNTYYPFPDERINEYDLHLFIRQPSGLYRKYQEIHLQKAHTPSEVEAALSESGLELLAIYDELTKNPPNAFSERLFFVVKAP